MRIAICDDNEKFCEILKNMVVAHLESTSILFEVEEYHSIRNMRSELSEGVIFDLIFLDIEFAMEQEDGIDLANYVREILKNEYSQIVYVSSEEKYAMKLFETRPLNFLVKPVEEKTVARVLDKAIQIQEVEKNIFKYSFSGMEYRIELGKILYFCSEGRKIHVICSDGKERFFIGKISDVLDELCKSKFFSPHRSYVINYYAVELWKKNELIMINGEHIPISRSNESEVRKLQLRYERS